MKKLVIILLMVAYGAASLGATVHVHYCMDKLVEWGITSCEGGMCSQKGMKGMDDEKCCKHTYEQLKVATHYKDAVIIIDFKKFTVIPHLIIHYQNDCNQASITLKNTYTNNNYLLKPNNKIYILNCVYRI